MFIQISALCSALNISDEKYKSSDLVMEKSTFEPLYDCNISSDINLLKDCECSVKRFLGTTENKLKLDSDAEINFINFEDTFISQKFCKYVKTTEAVEHVGKLDEHSSYKSETEIPHSHTVEVLPRPEIFENDYQDKEINPHKGDDVFVQGKHNSLILLTHFYNLLFFVCYLIFIIEKINYKQNTRTLI